MFGRIFKGRRSDDNVPLGNTVPLTATDEVLTAWQDVLPPEANRPGSRTSLACADVVDCMASDQMRLPAALERYGAAFGEVGWSLDQTARWMDELARIIGDAAASPLQTFAAGRSLAEGWGHGSHYGISQAQTVDPLTGVATLGVMRLRIGQVMDQCRTLGVGAHQVYCLVVIDVETNGLHGLERDATLVMVADRIQREFNGGETISYAAGRFLILASYVDEVRTKILDLIAEIRSVAFMTDRRALGWIEELPMPPDGSYLDAVTRPTLRAAVGATDLIDGYLLDLVS